MQNSKWRLLLSVLIGSVGTLFVLVGLLGMAPALAQGAQNMEEAAPWVQPPPSDDDWVITVYFTDPASISITDLSGNAVGTGIHEGNAKCYGRNCNQKATLQFTVPLTDWSFEYSFTTRQAVDPVAERVEVAGTGTIFRSGQSEEFTFVSTLQNNGDGTVEVKYEASRPDASFMILKAPGTFTVERRR